MCISGVILLLLQPDCQRADNFLLSHWGQGIPMGDTGHSHWGQGKFLLGTRKFAGRESGLGAVGTTPCRSNRLPIVIGDRANLLGATRPSPLESETALHLLGATRRSLLGTGQVCWTFLRTPHCNRGHWNRGQGKFARGNTPFPAGDRASFGQVFGGQGEFCRAPQVCWTPVQTRSRVTRCRLLVFPTATRDRTRKQLGGRGGTRLPLGTGDKKKKRRLAGPGPEK